MTKTEKIKKLNRKIWNLEQSKLQDEKEGLFNPERWNHEIEEIKKELKKLEEIPQDEIFNHMTSIINKLDF